MVTCAVNIQGVLGKGTLGYKANSNADNIQGVLGEGTLGYKVTLLLYRVCLVKAPWVTKEKAPWVIK